MTTAPVWVIQHVAAEGPGLIGEALRDRGLQMRSIHLHENDPVPRSLEGAAGIVVMGGPMGVYETGRYPFLAAEIELLREAVRRELPVLGICLGSQLLAAALGARVYPSGFQEIGWEPVRLTEAAAADPLCRELPPEFPAFHWHGDLFELPAGAVALASSELTSIQAFRAGRLAYGVLFHLEVTGGQITEMVSVFGDELRRASLSGTGIIAGATRHLAELQSHGRRFFGAWADLLLRPTSPGTTAASTPSFRAVP